MGFPARFKTYTPEGYADVALQIRVNPTSAELSRLALGATTDEDRPLLGAALMAAYAGGKVEAYGVSLDFSTVDAALATIDNDALPDDLRYWLRNAPVDVAIEERTLITKNYVAS